MVRAGEIRGRDTDGRPAGSECVPRGDGTGGRAGVRAAGAAGGGGTGAVGAPLRTAARGMAADGALEPGATGRAGWQLGGAAAAAGQRRAPGAAAPPARRSAAAAARVPRTDDLGAGAAAGAGGTAREPGALQRPL